MEMNWIPVEERLPELPDPKEKYQSSKIEVLVTYEGCKGNKTTSMDFVKEFVRGKLKSRFYWNGKLSIWNVIAWMPMPEPYKKEGSV